MIQYILEVIAFQLVFLVIYDLFLKKETFFQWNRFYLIGTYVLSLIIPWIKIEAMKTTISGVFQDYPEFLWNMDDTSLVLSATQETGFNVVWENIVLFGGMALATIFFSYKLYQIWQLKRNGAIQYFAEFNQVVVANSSLAFSFFKSIFLGDKVFEKEHQNIIRHELVHIRQRHSYDLLFFEFMRIAGWFNPLVYVYQSRISELHEFIADAQVAKTNKKGQYQLLLSHVFQTQHISFINQFFKSSLIKKRIVMLQRSRSKKIWQLKYLALVPIILGMLFYSSCESELVDGVTRTSEITVSDVQNLTVEEEKYLLGKLLSFSEEETQSDIVLGDDDTKITFSQIKNGSFISGPNGELIQARMIIDSKVLDEDFSLFQGKTNRLESLIDENLVPFAVIDQIPVFPGCEDAIDKRACFQKSMQKHIAKNFKYPEEAQEKGIQGRVSIMFTMDEEGNITNIRKRGPDKLLEDEAHRIIALLPKMKPGRLANGQPVSVPFSIPITFKLQKSDFSKHNRTDSEYERLMAQQLQGMPDDLKIAFQNAIPFEKVAMAPVFPGCEDLLDSWACFRKQIQLHISKNFHYPEEAQEMGIQGRVNVMFLISTEGNVTAIARRGPNQLLENEAVRIISKLPKMKPGKKANGEPVNVPFSIPISFKLK